MASVLLLVLVVPTSSNENHAKQDTQLQRPGAESPYLEKWLRKLETDASLDAEMVLGLFFQKRRLEAIDAVRTLRLNPKARDQAIRKILEIREAAKREVPVLINDLQHADPKVRKNACYNLQQIGPLAREAVPALIQSLRDNSAGVRSEACLALGWLGQERGLTVVPALQRAAQDVDANVRKAAGWALIEIQKARLVTSLPAR